MSIPFLITIASIIPITLTPTLTMTITIAITNIAIIATISCFMFVPSIIHAWNATWPVLTEVHAHARLMLQQDQTPILFAEIVFSIFLI